MLRRGFLRKILQNKQERESQNAYTYIMLKKEATRVAKKSSVPWQKIIFLAVFITMVGSAVTVGVSMWLAPTVPTEEHFRVKSDYVLMFLQCLLGILAMLLPSWLSRKCGLEIPSRMIILYAVFLYCAIYLGEVRGFYYLIPRWDTVLHVFSGIALGALGFSVLSLLNKSERVPVTLSPAFVALFAFCFAVSVDVVWEIYEFFADSVFLTNMQKHSNGNGVPLLGKLALADTMEDLIVDALGALLVSVLGYISLKFKKGWVEKILLKTRTTQ